MRLLGKIRNLVRSASKNFHIELAMDLGTANTLIYLKGKGIVVNEPSVVAIDIMTKQTVALGRQAREFLGRTPPHIRAERPLKDGVIADFDAAMAMIKGFLGMAFTPRFWVNPLLVIGVPLESHRWKSGR